MNRHRLALVLLVVVAASFLRPALAQTPPPPGQGPGPGPRVTLPDAPKPKKGKVKEENQKPGDSSWKSAELARGRGTPLTEPTPGAPANAAAAAWTDTPIRGYAGATSINKGGSIPLYISTALASYRLDVYRMGYYGGAGARLLSSVPSLLGQNQAAPTPDANGLVAASWSVSYTLSTGADWVSGFYLVKLTASSGDVGYIVFVLRDDGDPADILYQAPFTTYQAYNNWGGKSLYDFNSTGGIQAVKVSFDRPYTAWSGAGSFFDGDYNMVRWLEERGYDVDYASSIDLQTSPSIFTGRKVFLSNFHDEYWSAQMRTNLTNARNAGVHLAFFDANNIYWQIRFEASSSGVANRVIVGYKESAPQRDPVGPTSPLLTTVWRDAPVNQPENALLGVMYESNFNYTVAYPWVVQNAANWVYTGTGLINGAQIPDLVGYEYDKVWNNGQTPAGLVSLSASPVVDGSGVKGTQNAGLYKAASGAWVFSAGTIRWAWKLDDNDYQHWGADDRVQRMTINVLNTMLTGVTPAPTPTPTPSALLATIYSDALSPNWSIDTSAGAKATVNLANTSPVYGGARSISFTPTGGYGYLGFIASAPLDISGYGALRFAAQAMRTGQRYSLNLYDQNGQQVGNDIVLANYGGDPVPGAWKLYTIPFDADNFNAQGHLIKSIVIQDYLGPSQTLPFPTLYVDEIGFSSAPVIPPAINPVPTLTSIAPSTAVAGGAAFTLTASGSGFSSVSVVNWNGSARPTTYVSATTLTAAIPASDIATAGTASVTVVTPAPGGGASAAQTFTISAGAVACNAVSLTSNVASPQVVGATITFTAAASPCPTPLYQFWTLAPGVGWTIAQAYSASNTFAWNTTGLSGGTYQIAVWAKQQGSSASFEWANQMSYTLNSATAPCSAVSLTASPTSPRATGTAVTFSAAASPCATPVYQFWLLPPGGAWTVAQTYSTSGTFNWSTTGLAAGTYQVAVWTKAQGSSATFEWSNQLSYTLTSATAPCTSVSLSISPPSPKPAGTTVTATALAGGCSTPTYQFWVLPPGGAWTIAQAYSSSGTFVWNTTSIAPGTYQIAVWAKQSGTGSTLDWSNQSSYTLQ